MKATVELPDDLMVAAKKRAAELRRPLRALIEHGLRAELGLALGGPKDQARNLKLTWVTVEGGLPAGIDVADRAAMHEWLRLQQ